MWNKLIEARDKEEERLNSQIRRCMDCGEQLRRNAATKLWEADTVYLDCCEATWKEHKPESILLSFSHNKGDK